MKYLIKYLNSADIWLHFCLAFIIVGWVNSSSNDVFIAAAFVIMTVMHYGENK